MQSRNEPSALQIVLDELRQLRADVRIDIGALRADLATIHKRTEEAHDEIEKYKNRGWGFAIGTGIGGGGIGAFLAKLLS